VGTKKKETAGSDQKEDHRAGNGERDRAHETEQPKFDVAYRWSEMFHRVLLAAILMMAERRISYLVSK
jgi:hypothetical protein